MRTLLRDLTTWLLHGKLFWRKHVGRWMVPASGSLFREPRRIPDMEMRENEFGLDALMWLAVAVCDEGKPADTRRTASACHQSRVIYA
jgi:hypothetical protein